MTTTNIAALPDAQSFGWADAPFSRLAAGSVSFGGRLSLTGQSLTGSQADSLASLAATWNTTGAPVGLRLAITNTASGSAAKFISCLGGVGGTTELVSVGTTGRLGAQGGIWLGPGSGAQTGRTVDLMAYQAHINLSASVGINWESTGTITGASDLWIRRDAANTLAQRNGASAQAFRLYNTFTDASNYERGFMRWNSNVLEIGTEAGGTGTARNLLITGGAISPAGILFTQGLTTLYHEVALTGGSPGTTRRVGLWPPANDVMRLTGITGAVGAAFQLMEMTAPDAPAADNVRIYAEDNGSGKTRLMALFATGTAQQIALEP